MNYKSYDEFKENNPKKGAPPKFKTAEDFYNSWVEYFKYCQENPLKKPEVVKVGEKIGENIHTDIPVPLSIAGYYSFHGFVKQTVYNTRDKGDDYLAVFEWGKAFCVSQRLNGAVIGNYKESIVSKLEGLADKQETKVDGTATVSFLIPDNGR